MALVYNAADYAVDLTSGRLLKPKDTVATDISGEHEQILIAQGVLLVVDGVVTPPEPSGKRTTVTARIPADSTGPFEIDITSATAGQVIGVDGKPVTPAAPGGVYRGAWAATTVYALRDTVLSPAPNSKLISRTAAGTSRASFDGTEAALWADVVGVASGLPAIAATVSAGGALAVNKHTPVSASGAARAMTLPTNQSAGSAISVEKTDNSANAVTITGSIRGVDPTTITLTLQNESVMFEADSAGSWWPVAGHKTLSSLDARYGASAAPIARTASWTLAAADDLADNQIGGSAAVNITLPSSTTAPTLAVGHTQFFRRAAGAGNCAFVKDTGVTVDGPGGGTLLTMARNGSGCFAEYMGSNVWALVGDLS